MKLKQYIFYYEVPIYEARKHARESRLTKVISPLIMEIDFAQILFQNPCTDRKNLPTNSELINRDRSFCLCFMLQSFIFHEFTYFFRSNGTRGKITTSAILNLDATLKDQANRWSPLSLSFSRPLKKNKMTRTRRNTNFPTIFACKQSSEFVRNRH